MILSCAGEQTIHVNNTFDISEANQNKYAYLVEQFEKHLQGKKDVAHERLCFNERTQTQGNTFASYLTDLKKITKRCEFEQLTEGLIRGKIIIGIRSVETRKKLMNCHDLTLEKTIMICKNDELNVTRMKDDTGR